VPPDVRERRLAGLAHRVDPRPGITGKRST
jgi:hypothetical protein